MGLLAAFQEQFRVRVAESLDKMRHLSLDDEDGSVHRDLPRFFLFQNGKGRKLDLCFVLGRPWETACLLTVIKLINRLVF